MKFHKLKTLPLSIFCLVFSLLSEAQCIDSPREKEVYRNCILKNYYQRQFCNKELYTQTNSDVVKCGRIYNSPENEQRIIICYDCHIYSPYNPHICASDRNAYATTFPNSFKGKFEDLPKFLRELAGSDLEEMLLKEREMFNKGFRAIYHVCNNGHWHGDRFINNDGNRYVSPLFLYQLFGVLHSLGEGLDTNSPEFIPCIPRYNNSAFDNVPNRESFIDLIIKSKGDCDTGVRNVGLVGVAALGGCYHNEAGGIVLSRYVRSQSINAVPHPHELIMNALKSSKIKLPLTEMENVINDLLKLAKHFHVVNSALLQIFLSDDAFLNHVCYSKNGGADIHPIDRKSIEDGKHLEPGIQLNVYLPTNLVTNREKCNIHLYTRCGKQNSPVPQNHLIEFRNEILNTINKYSQ